MLPAHQRLAGSEVCGRRTPDGAPDGAVTEAERGPREVSPVGEVVVQRVEDCVDVLERAGRGEEGRLGREGDLRSALRMHLSCTIGLPRDASEALRIASTIISRYLPTHLLAGDALLELGSNSLNPLDTIVLHLALLARLSVPRHRDILVQGKREQHPRRRVRRGDGY